MPRRIYVIELDREAGRRRDPRIPWVYVGSSSKPAELRLEQHLAGYKAARLVRRHGLRLRPDLYEDLEPVRTSKEAVAAEKARARGLARAGFVAHCDGTSHGARAGDWTEWGYRRMARVLDHVDAAITGLVECAFRPPSAEALVALLRGERAFWVADHLDQADPPPAYGLLSHVAADALERRIGELIRSGAVSERAGQVHPAG